MCVCAPCSLYKAFRLSELSTTKWSRKQPERGGLVFETVARDFTGLHVLGR